MMWLGNLIRVLMKIMINRDIIVITIAFDEEEQLSTQSQMYINSNYGKGQKVKDVRTNV